MRRRRYRIAVAILSMIGLALLASIGTPATALRIAPPREAGAPKDSRQHAASVPSVPSDQGQDRDAQTQNQAEQVAQQNQDENIVASTLGDSAPPIFEDAVPIHSRKVPRRSPEHPWLKPALAAVHMLTASAEPLLGALGSVATSPLLADALESVSTSPVLAAAFIWLAALAVFSALFAYYSHFREARRQRMTRARAERTRNTFSSPATQQPEARPKPRRARGRGVERLAAQREVALRGVADRLAAERALSEHIAGQRAAVARHSAECEEAAREAAERADRERRAVVQEATARATAERGKTSELPEPDLARADDSVYEFANHATRPSAAEPLPAQRIATEPIATERIRLEPSAAERLAGPPPLESEPAARRETERLAAERLAIEREAAARREAERLTAERDAARRLAARREAAEQEATRRLAAEREARLAAERELTARREAERLAAEREAAERKVAEQLVAEREAVEQLTAEQARVDRRSAPPVASRPSHTTAPPLPRTELPAPEAAGSANRPIHLKQDLDEAFVRILEPGERPFAGLRVAETDRGHAAPRPEAARRPSKDPTRVGSRLERAETLMERRDFAAAQEILQGLALEQPANPQVAHSAGRLALLRGQAGAAASWLERAVAIEPDDIVVRLDLCSALLLDQRFEDAIESGRVGLQGHPGDGRLLLRLSQATAELGAVDEAYDLAVDAVRSHKTRESVLHLTRLSALNHRLERGDGQRLRRALEKDPREPALLHAMGVFESLYGNTEDALALLESAVHHEHAPRRREEISQDIEWARTRQRLQVVHPADEFRAA